MDTLAYQRPLLIERMVESEKLLISPLAGKHLACRDNRIRVPEFSSGQVSNTRFLSEPKKTQSSCLGRLS